VTYLTVLLYGLRHTTRVAVPTQVDRPNFPICGLKGEGDYVSSSHGPLDCNAHGTVIAGPIAATPTSAMGSRAWRRPGPISQSARVVLAPVIHGVLALAAVVESVEIVLAGATNDGLALPGFGSRIPRVVGRRRSG
jgi:hypothetical protein